MILQNQFITSLHVPIGACLLLTKGQTSGGGLSISSRYLQPIQLFTWCSLFYFLQKRLFLYIAEFTNLCFLLGLEQFMNSFIIPNIFDLSLRLLTTKSSPCFYNNYYCFHYQCQSVVSKNLYFIVRLAKTYCHGCYMK